MSSASIPCWRCDVCGNLIDDPETGYVIWKRDEIGRGHGFKIVHRMKCDLKDHTASCALTDLLGHDGLTKLLSNLSLGPIKLALGQGPSRGVVDLDEYVDLIRRVQTPFYETARAKFNIKEVLDDFADASEIAPYMSDSLRRIANKY